MVRHHRARREAGWQWRMAINAIGALATFVVLGIIAITKFTSGAWIPIRGAFHRRLRFRSWSAGTTTRLAAPAVPPDGGRPHPSPNTAVVMVGQLPRALSTPSTTHGAFALTPPRSMSAWRKTTARVRRQWQELASTYPSSRSTPRSGTWLRLSKPTSTSSNGAGRNHRHGRHQPVRRRPGHRDLIHNRAWCCCGNGSCSASGVVVAAVPYRLSTPPS